MSFSSWADFWQMGGHGFYVWTAYAIGFAVLLINALGPFLAKKRFLRERKLEQQRQKRRERLSEDKA